MHHLLIVTRNFNTEIIQPMILAIDVHYKGALAKVVGAFFEPKAAKAVQYITTYINGVDEYVPGEFYKRELPCILKLLEKVELGKLNAIIIDGNVFINNNGDFGLGGRLWESIDHKVAVIGVAKSLFKNTEDKVIEIQRGKSEKHLFVSSIGIDLAAAASLIHNMHGEYRLPSILKEVDRLTKEA
ncbi:endonuclease V [Mucilaginibacter sp. Mucisp84]|uniref:endonuclease V n=1 Tax=Mucilaginibacter sp. Mucisp84 TaxID=3243058 RepID=UPI0039A4BB7F